MGPSVSLSLRSKARSADIGVAPFVGRKGARYRSETCLQLCFVELSQRIEDQVGVTERRDRHGKFFSGLLKLEAAGRYLHDLPETWHGYFTGSFGPDNFSIVEKYSPTFRTVGRIRVSRSVPVSFAFSIT